MSTGLLYESQTIAVGAKTCYGPRLVRTHSTSDAARLAAVFTGFLLVASVPVALAADAVGPDSQVASLRAADQSLEGRANAATLELYALEAELGQARSAAASIAARQAVVERDRAAARKQLAIARNAVNVSESRLAELVRALYEQSGHVRSPRDPARRRVARGGADRPRQSQPRRRRRTSRIIEQARSSRQRLAALDTRLAAREAELTELGAAAAARARALADAAETRRRFVAGLRHQQGLNAARIASIEEQARSAETRTTAIATTAAPVTRRLGAARDERPDDSPSAPRATPCADAPPRVSRPPRESSPSIPR